MTRPGGSDLSPVERAARVFTPKVRGIEINREGTERKRECVRRSGGGVGGGEGGCLCVCGAMRIQDKLWGRSGAVWGQRQ